MAGRGSRATPDCVPPPLTSARVTTPATGSRLTCVLATSARYPRRDAVRRVHPRSGRAHAARPDLATDRRPRPARTPAAPAGQARDAQSGRLRQGPHRPADDRGGRAGRPAAARRHDHRADLGQHRSRPRHRRRAQGLSLHLRDGRQAVVREAAAPARVRRRGRPLPDQRRPRIAGELLLGRRAARPRHPGRVQARPVLERREPGRPRADDRPRAVGPDRRADHPFRRQRRDRRHDLAARRTCSRRATRRSRSSARTRRAASCRATRHGRT